MSAPTQQEVNRILVSIDRGNRDQAYTEKIYFDVQEIEGTRYKFRLSEKEPER